MPELDTTKAPTLRDALVAAAAMVSVDVLLLGQGLLLLRADLPRSVALTVLPVAVVVALAVPTVMLVRHMRRRGLELGFSRLGRRGWHLLWQAPVVVLGSASATALVAPLFGIESGGGSTGEVLARDLDSATPVLMLLAGYLLIGPCIEEIVFRRVLMRYFDTLMPPAASVVATSAIFGAAHIAPPAIVFTFFSGIGLALVARFHGNITSSFIVHVVNNLLASAAVIGALF
ncbi:CPBP family intramembrane glutamic endopeptidase [Corynebacterium fournieri]|uniref:CPBP family intramembrane glutamic endopeptidase n=1 Tax=Corynebacterium fournieri TaxID=1852390 RepID=UPI000A2F6988|nr:CPBP family intramembrane glutamic endopeptidase [Corynebacterium fournieri]WJY97228.1 CAAX amino terminal protease self- immunity [Corynebacterium fournieri]